MERKTVVVKSASGRDFVVYTDGRNVYVGTQGIFSNVAAQMIVHEAMETTGLVPTWDFMNLQAESGEEVIAVGYQLPLFARFSSNPISKVEKALAEYVYKQE